MQTIIHEIDRYPFPIDVAPNGIPIGAESIGKGYLQSKLGLD